MIKLYYLLIFLLGGNIAVAQTDLVVVLHNQGNTNYTTLEGSESKDLYPGLTLPIEGTIFLDDDAKVKLIVNQKSVLLNGKGRYDIKDIYDSNTKKSMSFSSRFWKFVTAGMSTKDDKKELAKYHQQYMNVHGGVRGYSSGKSNIQLVTPVHGKVAASQLNLEWKSNMDGPVTINLYDATRSLVSTQQSITNSSTLDLKKLKIINGENYFLELVSPLAQSKNITETSFTYAPEDAIKVVERLGYLPSYEIATTDEKQWMKAVVFEMEEYYYDTYTMYQQMLYENPDNLLLKKTFANYLVRQDQLTNAQALLFN